MPQAGSRTVSSFLRVNDGHDEVNDMARGAELPGVALRAEHGQQILEGIAQTFGVVVAELVDDLEKFAQGLGIAVGQKGVLEDVPKQRRNTGVLRHPGNGFSVEIEHLVSAQAGVHQLGPAVAGELVGEERCASPPNSSLSASMSSMNL